jgi:hypothetical protein
VTTTSASAAASFANGASALFGWECQR